MDTSARHPIPAENGVFEMKKIRVWIFTGSE